MTAVQLLGAWFGLSVPVALVVGAALHHGLAVPRADHRASPAPVRTAVRSQRVA
jgi:hypothetical protein